MRSSNHPPGERRRARGARALPDGVIVIDKPAGIGSYDVIRLLAPVLGRTKTGFVGTLDPFATGVLPLVLGEATKLVPLLLEESKEYVARVRLGVRTDTGDRTGAEIEHQPVPPLERGAAELAGTALTGRIAQVPPMYSALREGGERLYEKARRGEVVERRPRDVTVYALELLEISPPDALSLRVECSSGTYIRVLAEDLAARLGTVGHLAELRRTRAGSFSIDRAVEPERILSAGRQELVERWLEPFDALATHLPALDVDAADALRVANGNPIADDQDRPEGTAVRLRSGGRLLAIARTQAHQLQPVRVFPAAFPCRPGDAPESST